MASEGLFENNKESWGRFFAWQSEQARALLITFEVFVLHIVLDPLCTSIGSIVFKCEGKDTNLFSNIQIFNAEK